MNEICQAGNGRPSVDGEQKKTHLASNSKPRHASTSMPLRLKRERENLHIHRSPETQQKLLVEHIFIEFWRVAIDNNFGESLVI